MVVVAALGAAYYIKDERGVSYLERGYTIAHRYTVGVDFNPVQEAHSIKTKMQMHEDATQAAIDE